MSMVITLRDAAAVRASALAAAAGVSEDEVVAQLVLAAPSPGPAVALTEPDGQDALEAFFGCGDSGNREPMTIQEMRRDLAARKFAGGTRNI
jgi:hypothetical protein